MKPIESEPSHLFSPHLYNQSGSKTSQTNKNNNIISENRNVTNESEKISDKISSGIINKNGPINKYEKINNLININAEINNDNNNQNYERFEEDERDNINLDSINHNSSNTGIDLGSQAKSFFNSAINSITNFGGIIKDQLQNAKDTVIDSFTGNDTNNYNESNNYEYNNNQYYDYNNSNINVNYNNEINISSNINNNDNRKNSSEQNDAHKSQNSNDRKVSIDSGNELCYIRQDIADIVNKLKEFDTRYNMFFNDEDKKNFRIIIDYLKAKL